jgi:DNA polymerase
MAERANGIEGADVRHFLPWLVEMGADEILLDEPVNRFAQDAAETATGTVAEVPGPRSPLPVPRAPSRPLLGGAAELLEDARRRAEAASTIAALRAAWQSFDAHPLKRTATRLCFFSGAEEARALVLCDKPRSEEDPTGEVLSGKHQQLAENMLAAIGLCGHARRNGLEQVALANFIPWRPPGNRPVAEIEASLALPFVQRLLALLRPRAVLCLGSLPGQFLADGDPAIFRARGKWRTVACAGRDIPLMTTFHPETLLKSPQSKKLAWADLQNFRDRLNAND